MSRHAYHCPFCDAEAASDARRCRACGLPLPYDPTQPAALDTVPQEAPVPGALWLEPTPQPPAVAKPAAKPAASPAPAATPAPAAPPAPDREARRASVRRARLRAQAETDPGPVVPEVLVLHRDGVERGVVCDLLQGFGFATHACGDAEQGAALLDGHRFAAVFAAVMLDSGDGGAGIAFARAVKALAAPPLLVLLAPPLSPVDRVRATLAGFDDHVLTRADRGSLARVLDGHGIPLPVDPRRGAA